MAIKTGRYGTVKYDPAGVTPVALIAINQWKLSQKTEYTDVSVFSSVNKEYVPGLKDISGSFSGFWDSTNVVIFDAVDATTPGKLELAPNSTEPTFKWSGLAYIDADIDVDLKVPKISATFMGAGPWTMAP